MRRPIMAFTLGFVLMVGSTDAQPTEKIPTASANNPYIESGDFAEGGIFSAEGRKFTASNPSATGTAQAEREISDQEYITDYIIELYNTAY